MLAVSDLVPRELVDTFHHAEIMRVVNDEVYETIVTVQKRRTQLLTE